MKTYSTPLFYPAAVVAAFVLSQPFTHAALLLNESFNYGITDATTINGAASTGTGTTGNWSVTNSGTNNSSVYTNTGLTFGSNYTTSGGGLRLQSTYNSSTNESTLAMVKLGTSVTGTLWSSYLANYSAIGNANTGFGQVGVSQDAGATSQLLSQVYSNQVASDRKLGTAYDTTPTASSNTAFATGTTYMFISKFTNVGTELSVGTTGVATTWVLTEAQYTNFYNSGFSETFLDTTGNHFKKQSDTAVSSGTFNFNTDGYLTLRSNAPNSNGFGITVTFDEIKFGNELVDVTSAIPEPSTYAMIAGVAGLAGAMFRRRRSSAA